MYKNLGNMNQTIYQGPGAIHAIPEVCATENWERVMIVADPFLIASGMIATFEKILVDAGIKYCIFSNVRPNPEAVTIETQGLTMFTEFNAHVLLAIGGGSTIDTAKGISMIYGTGKTVEMVSNEEMRPWMKSTRELVPIIAVPTTCGTGSECTKAAVICNQQGTKLVPINDSLLAKYAICDPNLLASLPRTVAATTAMDTLVQAAEIFVGRGVGDIAWIHSRRAIELCGKSIRQYVDNPAITIHANNISLACMHAGIAWQQYIPTQIHGGCHCLTERYGIPHGDTCAVLFPAWVLINGWAAYDRMHELYNLLFPELIIEKGFVPKLLADALVDLNDYFNIMDGKTLREWGCSEEEIDGNLLNNCEIFPSCPCSTDINTIRRMYKLALDGYKTI